MLRVEFEQLRQCGVPFEELSLRNSQIMVAAGLLLSGCWHSGHHDTARPGFRSYAAWLEKGLSRLCTKVAWAG